MGRGGGFALVALEADPLDRVRALAHCGPQESPSPGWEPRATGQSRQSSSSPPQFPTIEGHSGHEQKCIGPLYYIGLSRNAYRESSYTVVQIYSMKSSESPMIVIAGYHTQGALCGAHPLHPGICCGGTDLTLSHTDCLPFPPNPPATVNLLVVEVIEGLEKPTGIGGIGGVG